MRVPFSQKENIWKRYERESRQREKCWERIF